MRRLFLALWGDLSWDEAKKFCFLALISMVIVGNYWTLRVMKNAIFGNFVSYRTYQPWAKVISLVVVALLVMGYSRLVDLVKKESLFYGMVTFFGLWELGLAYAIAHPTLFAHYSMIPGNIIGWISFLSIEALPLMIALFWAFVASTTDTESAKRGYGIILFTTQIGTIGGSLFVVYYAASLGIPTIMALSAATLFLVPLLIKCYTALLSKQARVFPKDKKQSTGFIEGLSLLLTRPYVMGIFFVATAYQVIGTILEFQMNTLGKMIYPVAADFAAFHGKFGIGVNCIALLFSFFGTSFLMRKFGLRFCLLVFPVVVGSIVIALVFYISFGGMQQNQLIWLLFGGLMGIKGLNYALNGPTKEIMYIPTSRDVKFKAKGWIDLFGNRSTKATGAGVNILFKESLASLFIFGSIISLGIVGIWIIIAFMVGKKFQRLVEKKAIIS